LDEETEVRKKQNKEYEGKIITKNIRRKIKAVLMPFLSLSYLQVLCLKYSSPL
jgi:hypothetical protein